MKHLKCHITSSTWYLSSRPLNLNRLIQLHQKSTKYHAFPPPTDTDQITTFGDGRRRRRGRGRFFCLSFSSRVWVRIIFESLWRINARAQYRLWIYFFPICLGKHATQTNTYTHRWTVVRQSIYTNTTDFHNNLLITPIYRFRNQTLFVLLSWVRSKTKQTEWKKNQPNKHSHSSLYLYLGRIKIYRFLSLVAFEIENLAKAVVSNGIPKSDRLAHTVNFKWIYVCWCCCWCGRSVTRKTKAPLESNRIWQWQHKAFLRMKWQLSKAMKLKIMWKLNRTFFFS